MKESDKHGRAKGPADRQAESDNSYTLPVEVPVVHEILDLLKKEQQRNKDLTEAVLNLVNRYEAKVEVVKPEGPEGPRLTEPLREKKSGKAQEPELGNVYFDVSEDGDIECNFDELSDAESVSKTGINTDKLKKLRKLIKKGE